MGVIRQLTLWDDTTGEHVMTRTLADPTQNEGEWIIMYRAAINELVDKAPNFTTLKVFLKLAQMQEYDRPIKTTKKSVADQLNTTYDHVHRAFKWLEAENYIVETKDNGQTQFELNPHVTTCGKQRNKKLARWNDLQASKLPKNAQNIINLSGIK